MANKDWSHMIPFMANTATELHILFDQWICDAKS